MRFLPDAPASRKDPCAIVINMPRTSALFKDFLPPAGSPVQYVPSTGKEPAPMPAGYTPGEEDILQFTVRQSTLPADKTGVYASDAAEAYQQRALSLLRARGQKPSSGILTVTARLAPDEDPAGVTFLLDGNVAGILNRPPFFMKLDTRDWSNGEHLIEIRAVDHGGATLTRNRILVVVENPKTP